MKHMIKRIRKYFCARYHDPGRMTLAFCGNDSRELGYKCDCGCFWRMPK